MSRPIAGFLSGNKEIEYCPSCGKDMQVFLFINKKSVCQCCYRTFCSSCLITVEDYSKNQHKLCYGCYLPYQSTHGKLKELIPHLPCIPKLATSFLSSNRETRKTAYDTFAPYWISGGIGVDYIVRSGMTQSLIALSQDGYAVEMVTDILGNVLRLNIDLKLFFDKGGYEALAAGVMENLTPTTITNTIFVLGEIFMSNLKNYSFRSHLSINDQSEELIKLKIEYEENYSVFWTEKESRLGKAVSTLQKDFVSESLLKMICSLYANATSEEREVLLLCFSFFEMTCKTGKLKIVHLNDDTMFALVHCLTEQSCLIILPLILFFIHTNDDLFQMVDFGVIEAIANILKTYRTEPFANIVDIFLLRLSKHDVLFPRLINSFNLFSSLLQCESDTSMVAADCIETLLTYKGFDEKTVAELILTEHIDVLEMILGSALPEKKDKGVIIFDCLMQMFGSECFSIFSSRGIIDTILMLCRTETCNSILLYIALTHILLHPEIRNDFIQSLIQNDFICYLCTSIDQSTVLDHIIPFFVLLADNEDVQYDIFYQHSGNQHRFMKLLDKPIASSSSYKLLSILTTNTKYANVILNEFLQTPPLLSTLFRFTSLPVNPKDSLPLIRNIFLTKCNENTFIHCTTSLVECLIANFPKDINEDIIPYIEVCYAICSHSQYLRNHFTSSVSNGISLLQRVIGLVTLPNQLNIRAKVLEVAMQFLQKPSDYSIFLKLCPMFYIQLFDGLKQLDQHDYKLSAFEFIFRALLCNREVDQFKQSTLQQCVLDTITFTPMSSKLLEVTLKLFVLMYDLNMITIDYHDAVNILVTHVLNISFYSYNINIQLLLIKTLFRLHVNLDNIHSNHQQFIDVLCELLSSPTCYNETISFLQHFITPTFLHYVRLPTLLILFKEQQLIQQIHNVLLSNISNDMIIFENEELQYNIINSSTYNISTTLQILVKIPIQRTIDLDSFMIFLFTNVQKLSENDVINILHILLHIQTLDNLALKDVPFLDFFKYILNFSSQQTHTLIFDLIRQSTNDIDFLKSILPLVPTLIDIIIENIKELSLLLPFCIFPTIRYQITTNQQLFSMLFSNSELNEDCALIISQLLIDDTFLPLLLLSINFHDVLNSKSTKQQLLGLKILQKVGCGDGTFLTIDYLDDIKNINDVDDERYDIVLEILKNHLHHPKISDVLIQFNIFEKLLSVVLEKYHLKTAEFINGASTDHNIIQKYGTLDSTRKLCKIISRRRTYKLEDSFVSECLCILNAFLHNLNTTMFDKIQIIQKYSQYIISILKNTNVKLVYSGLQIILFFPQIFIELCTPTFVNNVVNVVRINPTNNGFRDCVVLFLSFMISNQHVQKRIKEFVQY
ncbi:FYVE-type domain-containing protein [Entamoeba marina]